MGLPLGSYLPSELKANLSVKDKRVIEDVVGQLITYGCEQSAAVAPFIALRERTDGQFPQVLVCIRTVFKTVPLLLDPNERSEALRCGYKFLCQLMEVYTGISAEQRDALTARLDLARHSAGLLERVQKVWDERNSGPGGADQPYRGVGRAGTPRNKSSGHLPSGI